MKPAIFALKLQPALLAAALYAVVSGAQAQDADCSMCHDAAPVPADHMPVDEVSVTACTMCHETDGGDPFFRAIHDKHTDLGCETCHEDAAADRKARLQEMLAQ